MSEPMRLIKDHFLESKFVKVYPSSFRGNYVITSGAYVGEQPSFDPESHLNTEFNIINSGTNIKDTYIKRFKVYNDGSYDLTCVIGGYYFEFYNLDPTKFVASTTSGNVTQNIYIRTREVILKSDTDSTTGLATDSERHTYVLASCDGDTESLDLELNTEPGTYYFTGAYVGTSLQNTVAFLKPFVLDENGSPIINSAAYLPHIECGMGTTEDATSTKMTAIVTGTNTKADGGNSIALGTATKAIGESSIAGGRNTTSLGVASKAFGDNIAASHVSVTAINTSTREITLNSIQYSGQDLIPGNILSYNTLYATKYLTISSVSGNIITVAEEDLSNLSVNQELTVVLSAATGQASSIEGIANIASNSAAKATGNLTRATGENSIATGFKTIASGMQAIAEGNQTIASGENAHAEGKQTVATGNNAHAEGSYVADGSPDTPAECGAKGTSAHSEGYNTLANNIASHAEGARTAVYTKHGHAEGYGTRVELNTTDTSAESGKGGHAEGYLTATRAQYAHAEGDHAVASGNASHAEGLDTIASGQAAHAEGEAAHATTKAAHAEGGDTTASGIYSHAEGHSTEAAASDSHAEGVETIVSTEGTGAHAEGYKTKAKGLYSHAEGENSGNIINTEGQASHSEGYKTKAKGNYSHAEGQNTVAEGEGSHAEGIYTKASGKNSHAEGIGLSNTSLVASGEGAHAEGYCTTASGAYSHAEGYQTTTNAAQARSLGKQTLASGENSIAAGLFTVAENANEVVIGKYNKHTNNDGRLFVIGNGDTEGTRHNAFEVQTDSNSPLKKLDDTNLGLNLLLNETGLDEIIKKTILDVFFPVGSIYTCDSNVTLVNNQCPIETNVGGTWTRLEGRFLLGAGTTSNTTNSYTIGSDGGYTDAVAVGHTHTAEFTGTDATTNNTTPELEATVAGQTVNTGGGTEHIHTIGNWGPTFDSSNNTGDAWFEILDKVGSNETVSGADGTYCKNVNQGDSEKVSLENRDAKKTHPNRIYLALNHTHTCSSESSHTHSVTIASQDVAFAEDTGTHNHTFTATGNVTVSANSSETGTGKNMPPYHVVYIWKRTA